MERKAEFWNQTDWDPFVLINSYVSLEKRIIFQSLNFPTCKMGYSSNHFFRECLSSTYSGLDLLVFLLKEFTVKELRRQILY